MKNLKILFAVCAALVLSAAAFGQTKNNAAKSGAGQASDAPKAETVAYDKVSDFTSDFGAHRVGERFIITDVAATKIAKHSRADRFGNASYKNLFFLEPSDGDDTETYGMLLTSPAMIKSLTDKAAVESLRITAVLVESRGRFDVDRMPFVVKIEGVTEGSVLWTATGAEPLKTKFVH